MNNLPKLIWHKHGDISCYIADDEKDCKYCFGNKIIMTYQKRLDEERDLKQWAMEELKRNIRTDIPKSQLLTKDEIRDVLFQDMHPVLCEKTNKGEWIIPNPENLAQAIIKAQNDKLNKGE